MNIYVERMVTVRTQMAAMIAYAKMDIRKLITFAKVKVVFTLMLHNFNNVTHLFIWGCMGIIA